MFTKGREMRSYKNILITGGLGFIGSHFVFLAKRSNQFQSIVIVDAGTYASNEELVYRFINDGIHVYKMDINDKSIENVLIHHQIDLIVNFAAESHVTNSLESPDLFIKTNVNGTFNLIDKARQVWGKRRDVLFHQVSTDEVYGSVNGPIDEKHKYNPGNPYSASKACADHIVSSYANAYGIPVTISHGCNTFGILQNEEKFIPLNIKRITEGKTVTIHAGEHIRQWCTAEFHATAIFKIVQYGNRGEHYNINMGSNLVKNNIDILEAIRNNYCEIVGDVDKDSIEVELIEDRPGNDHRYHCMCSKISSLFSIDEWDGFINSVDDAFYEAVKFYVEKFSQESE